MIFLTEPGRNSPEAINHRMSQISGAPQKPTLRHLLSNREFDVLTLLLAGDTPKEIAAALGINRTSVNPIPPHQGKSPRRCGQTGGIVFGVGEMLNKSAEAR